MKRILVAEDDPDVSGLVKTLLEAAGHEIRIVEDGEKALEVFVREGADLVVLDVLLPGRNGFQVAESIRAGEQGADVPIVMLSGVYRGPTYRTQARRRFGAVEYLEKPVEVDRLLTAVLQGLESPRPRFLLDGEPDDEPTEMSAQGLPPLPVPPRPAAARQPEPERDPAPAPAPAPEPTPAEEPFAEETASTGAAEAFDPTAPTGAWQDEPASSVAATERDPDPEPVRVETGATTTGHPPLTDDPGASLSEGEPPSEADSVSSATEPYPSVRSLAASARALSGASPDASAPAIISPRIRAPRPSSGLKALSFDPEHVGHTDRLLSALKSPAPEITDSRKSPAARPSDLDEQEEGAFSLGQLPPAPDVRTTVAPDEAKDDHERERDHDDDDDHDHDHEPERDGTPGMEEPAAPPYADPESIREKRLVERSVRVTRGAAQGDLRHTPFPVLLHRLYKERVSGALLLVKDPVKKIVYFRDGLPVFVKSNLLSECLGKVLVRERLISDAQCRESLRLLQETKRQQGSLLIQMGALSDANLTYGLQLQLRTKLHEVFSWPSGEYRLSTRTRPPMETAMLESSIEEVLFEGIRAAFDPERLRRELEPCVDLYLALSKGAETRLAAMPMLAPDRQVVASINGARTVREILARATSGPGSAAQLVYALLCAELVETRTQPATSPPLLDSAPGTLTDTEGETLATAVSVPMAGATLDEARPASTPAAAATPTPVQWPKLPGRETPGAMPPQSTAELLAEADLPLLPASELDTLVENTLAAELHFQKAEAHLAAKRWDEAVRALQKANALCPEQPDFLASLGWALFCAHGEAAADQALREIGRALEASPRFDRAYLLRGFLWKAMGAIDDAVRDFQEALACNPDCAEARRELEGLLPVRDDELRR